MRISLNLGKDKDMQVQAVFRTPNIHSQKSLSHDIVNYQRYIMKKKAVIDVQVPYKGTLIRMTSASAAKPPKDGKAWKTGRGE